MIIIRNSSFYLSCLHLNLNLTGVTNQFVDFSFDLALNIATCLFLNQPKSTNEKACSIAYGVPSEICTLFAHQSSKGSSDKVYLGFPESQSQEECCFIATASNGTHTVLVEGSMLTKGTTVTIVCQSLKLNHMHTLKLMNSLITWCTHAWTRGGGEINEFSQFPGHNVKLCYLN